jgi:hypothetical protein
VLEGLYDIAYKRHDLFTYESGCTPSAAAPAQSSAATQLARMPRWEWSPLWVRVMPERACLLRSARLNSIAQICCAVTGWNRCPARTNAVLVEITLLRVVGSFSHTVMVSILHSRASTCSTIVRTKFVFQSSQLQKAAPRVHSSQWDVTAPRADATGKVGAGTESLRARVSSVSPCLRACVPVRALVRL